MERHANGAEQALPHDSGWKTAHQWENLDVRDAGTGDMRMDLRTNDEESAANSRQEGRRDENRGMRKSGVIDADRKQLHAEYRTTVYHSGVGQRT